MLNGCTLSATGYNAIFVEDSTITVNGNRGGHVLSCIFHQVDLGCNGEKLLSYTAGDPWLNGHTLTVSGGTSQTQEGSLWLGGVGRKALWRPKTALRWWPMT